MESLLHVGITNHLAHMRVSSSLTAVLGLWGLGCSFTLQTQMILGFFHTVVFFCQWQACVLCFWKEHQGIFHLVKGTLWGNCKFLLEHFQGTKAMIRGVEENAFNASLKYQACDGFDCGQKKTGDPCLCTAEAHFTRCAFLDNNVFLGASTPLLIFLV